MVKEIENKVVIDWLNDTDTKVSSISKSTGISRKTLHNWKNGSVPNKNKLKLLVKYYMNREVAIPVDIKGMIDKDYVIYLQNEYIQNINKDRVYNDVWNSLEYDVEQHIQLRRIKYFPIVLTRTMIDAGKWEVWNQVLGYSKEELEKVFDIGVEYPLLDHPIHGMITDECNTYLESIVQSVLSTFAFLRSIVGEYHIPFNVTYKAKDGRAIPSVANCMIDWSTMSVKAKVKFYY